MDYSSMRKHVQAFAVCLACATATPLLAQDDDPLAYENSLTGYDPARTATLLGENFAGLWRVTLEENGETLSGTALITQSGKATLTMAGSESEDNYTLVQSDPVIFEEGTGPFIASLGLRFRKDNPDAEPPDGNIRAVETLALPSSQAGLVVSYDETSVDLALAWDDAGRDLLRIQLATRDDMNRLGGRWAEERGADLAGGGIASWIRGDIRIDGVVVVDALDDYSTAYPFDRDGNRIEQRQNTRTLVVFGENLPEYADGVQLDSLSNSIKYLPDFTPPADRERIVAVAREKAGLPDDVEKDSFLLTAFMENGVTSGIQSLRIDGAPVSWPLQFANQVALLQWVSADDQFSDSFYTGEVVRVKVSLPEYVAMPDNAVGLRISRGNHQEEEDGVVTARAMDADAVDERFAIEFLSDPIHLVHGGDASLRPPDDENALEVPVYEGTLVNAAIVDPAQLSTLPKVVSATIFDNPGQLGPLWKDALDRVASCTVGSVAAAVNPPEGTSEDDMYRTFQNLDTAAEISRVMLTETDYSKLALPLLFELKTRSVTFENGDHAAAILVRDEFVSQNLALIPTLREYARNPRRALEMRKRAMASPQAAASPIWDTTEASFERPGFLWNSTITMPLRQTLDLAALADQLGISEERAAVLALDETTKASLQAVDQMQAAINWASDISDCDLRDLLLIAGHDAPGVVARILPRLVRQETDAATGRRYWAPDTDARDFLGSLKIAGEQVRALDEASEADTNMAMAVAAVATLGGSLVLEGLGYSALAAYTMLAGEVIGLVDGLRGWNNYLDAEINFDLAAGAAPVMGYGILDEASAARQNGALALVAALAPAPFLPDAVRRAALPSLGALRNFRNVRQGRQVFGELDDLGAVASRSEADQLAVSGYYLDLAERSRRSGINSLSAADQEALETFNTHFRNAGLTPPSTARFGIETSDDAFRNAPTERITVEAEPVPVSNADSPAVATGDDAFRNAPTERITVEVEPVPVSNADIPGVATAGGSATDNTAVMPSLGPNGEQSLTLEDVLAAQYFDDSPPLPPVRNPVPDYSVTEPGSLSNHLTPDEVRELFRPGINLRDRPDLLIIKADLIRSGRVPAEYGIGDPALAATMRERFRIQPPEGPVAPNPAALDTTIIQPGPGVDIAGNTTILEPGIPPGGLADDIAGNTTLLDIDVPTPGTAIPEEPVENIALASPAPNEALQPPASRLQDDTDTLILNGFGDSPGTPLPVNNNSASSPVVSGQNGTLRPDEVEAGRGGIIYTEGLDAELKRLRLDAVENQRNYVGGSMQRLDDIRFAESFLKSATPEELIRVETIQQQLKTLGVEDLDALHHAAFFRYRAGTDSGFGPAVLDAMTVIRGIEHRGTRRISSLELARVCNISPTAARAAIQRYRQIGGGLETFRVFE